MPLKFARKLTGKHRTRDADRQLGYVLAFVAGAINAGGFLAVHQYTSHMTGVVSSMADNLVVGTYGLVLTGLGSVMSFTCGAACSAILVNHARRRGMHSEYAFPLLLEALLLLGFGAVGAEIGDVEGWLMSATVMLLCFILGLQNATITKLSNSEIRTTHLTGIVTDIGIEIGKLIYWNSPTSPSPGKVLANRERLKVLFSLAGLFFLGGVAGAFGFKHVGYVATVPLAVMLLALAIIPAIDDLMNFVRRHRNSE